MTQAEPPVPASWAPTKAEVCKARAMICNTMAVLGAHLEVGSPEYCDILRQRTACVNDHLVTMLNAYEAEKPEDGRDGLAPNIRWARAVRRLALV